MKVLIDTNVLLDFLLGRQPYFDDADCILRLCADKKAEGYMAAHSVPNMFYILRKDFAEKDRRKILPGLCDILKIEGVDSEIIISALKTGEFSDLEDCIQSRCANNIGAKYIITRNVRDLSGIAHELTKKDIPENGVFSRVSGYDDTLP